MNLEEQCISLQQAKKLKELGFERNSIFTYSKPGTKYGIYRNNEIRHPKLISDYNAYTASELMDILPVEINGMILQIKKFRDDSYAVGYFAPGYCSAEYKENLAQALGDMLIYCLENGLINAK